MTDHEAILPTGARERTLDVADAQIHTVELGDGPLVLLLHGFPEGWWAWRHQIPALAESGYRVVAVDLRGYGGSSRPSDVEAYRMIAHVGDAVGVVHALGTDSAVAIGHDWGSPIASTCALMRPDLFTAVGLLGVPYTPRAPVRPSEMFGQMGGDEEFYVSYFQEAGRAEAEIEPNLERWLRGFYAALDGSSPDAPGWFMVPKGAQMRDRFPTDDSLPIWLSEGEFRAHAAEFERNGITGPLNRYRNMDRDWEDLAALEGAVIKQPAIFIAGGKDSSIAWLAEAVEHQSAWLPGLTGTHLVEGKGHWVQQEAPDEVNRLLVDWLAKAVEAAGTPS
jgi:epoxide hydrolase A/B